MRLRPRNSVFCCLGTLAVLLFLWLPILRLYANSGVLDVPRLAAAFCSPLSRALLGNTLLLGAGTGLLTVLIGFPVGYAAARGLRILHPIILAWCALPLALPPTLLASAYLEYSRLPPARSVASLAAEHALTLNSNFIAAPVLALCYFPLAAFAVWSALQLFSVEWEDAALLFGNPAAWRRRILAPLLAPALCGAGSVAAALAMWEMGAPDLLDARTYSVQIYRAFSAGGGAGAAAIAALPMFALGLLFFAPTALALRRYQQWGFDSSISRGHVGGERHGTAWTATAVAFVALLLSPVAPLLVFWQQARPLTIFAEVAGDNRIEIGNTLLAPAMAVGMMVPVALGVVLSWREYSTRLSRLVWLLLVAPLLFAPILLAVATLEFYNQAAFDWLNDTRYGLLLVGFAARFLPLAMLWLHEALRRVPSTLSEAACGLGASPLRTVGTILLPLLASALLALCAVLFALCAGDLSLAVLLNAPGGQTLPVPIFNQMHIGATEQVAALSLLLLALSGGVLLAGLLLGRRLQHP